MRPWAESYWCIVEQCEGAAGAGWLHPTGPVGPLFLVLVLAAALYPVSCSAPGQYHDTRRFWQLSRPDLSCKIRKKVTAEVNRLLFSDGLEDATSSASPLASRDSVTKSSSTLSSTFSAVSPGDPTSAPLPEPFPPPPQILSPNPMTSLVDFLSPSPLGHSLPKEPFPPLGSEFPAAHAPPPLLPFFPLPPHDTLRVDPLLQAEATLTLNTKIGRAHV